MARNKVKNKEAGDVEDQITYLAVIFLCSWLLDIWIRSRRPCSGVVWVGKRHHHGPKWWSASEAHVVITNRATGIQREVDVDENGHYAVTDLPPGDYDLKVTASGFKPLTQTGLTVAANTVANADARLQVGAT